MAKTTRAAVARFTELADSNDGDCAELRFRFEQKRQADSFIAAAEHENQTDWFFEVTQQGDEWIVECAR